MVFLVYLAPRLIPMIPVDWYAAQNWQTGSRDFLESDLRFPALLCRSRLGQPPLPRLRTREISLTGPPPCYHTGIYNILTHRITIQTAKRGQPVPHNCPCHLQNIICAPFWQSAAPQQSCIHCLRGPPSAKETPNANSSRTKVRLLFSVTGSIYFTDSPHWSGFHPGTRAGFQPQSPSTSGGSLWAPSWYAA